MWNKKATSCLFFTCEANFPSQPGSLQWWEECRWSDLLIYLLGFCALDCLSFPSLLLSLSCTFPLMLPPLAHSQSIPFSISPSLFPATLYLLLLFLSFASVTLSFSSLPPLKLFLLPLSVCCECCLFLFLSPPLSLWVRVLPVFSRAMGKTH